MRHVYRCVVYRIADKAIAQCIVCGNFLIAPFFDVSMVALLGLCRIHYDNCEGRNYQANREELAL